MEGQDREEREREERRGGRLPGLPLHLLSLMRLSTCNLRLGEHGKNWQAVKVVAARR